MPKILNADPTADELATLLTRLFQSGHINFLIGSGASTPAIPILGSIESEIQDHLEKGETLEATKKLYRCIESVQQVTNSLVSNDGDSQVQETSDKYEEFTGIVEEILTKRRSTLLPKQATIFTTNYDLFIEYASSKRPSLNLNDGFRRAPSISNTMEFDSKNFFNSIYRTGNLYDYRVEMPSINLIKLHGSVSWSARSDALGYLVEKKDPVTDVENEELLKNYLSAFSIVLPEQSKFRDTVLIKTYYELLRIYANQLDRENVILVSFGFSFEDEHIRDITLRALRNPTLQLIVFAYDTDAAAIIEERFSGFNNVFIVSPLDGVKASYETFCACLSRVVRSPEVEAV